METKIVHEALIRSGLKLALAESCTGGKIGAELTSLPGTSAYFLGSIVAYSNDWKQQFLNVSPDTIKTNGAISSETVKEMVKGLLENTTCDLAVAISGVAGPDGGTPEKPVGTIYLATCRRGQEINIQVVHASPNRKQAIDFGVKTAFSAIFDLL